jgi:hypothetical protein
LQIKNRPGGPRPTREVEIRRETPNVWIDGTRVLVSWHSPNSYVAHPFFECPVCSRRCRHVYLRDRIACRHCHRLDWAARHVSRQTPGVARVERLRRKLGDCEPKPFAPLPARIRRGRRRAYHDKLVTMILDEETALLGHLQTVTRDLSRRIRVREARGKW